MSERYCCSSCFGDAGLRKSIIPKVAADESDEIRVGVCDYCGSIDVVLVPPPSLRQWFEIVCACYAEDGKGSPLVTWLKRDWKLFSHPTMDDAHAKDLLGDVFDDGEIVRQKFTPVESAGAQDPQSWEDLRSEMMHRNRWFLDDPIDLERLGELLAQLIAPAEEIPDTWYRARLQVDEKPFGLEEMGAPPSRLAGHGRANPAGIRYLYLGSNRSTAVSEIRPHTGERACVAEFSVSPSRLADLRDPRSLVSPFILEDAEQIALVRDGLPLLERLGQELTKPVQSTSAAFEYIPSQYLCEFIKKQGFQGVLYRSSVSEGMNLALFDPDLATARSVDTIRVDRVTVDISEPVD